MRQKDLTCVDRIRCESVWRPSKRLTDSKEWAGARNLIPDLILPSDTETGEMEAPHVSEGPSMNMGHRKIKKIGTPFRSRYVYHTATWTLWVRDRT